MLQEIGSNFWLSEEEIFKGDIESLEFSPLELGFKGADCTWTSNGRAAINLVIKTIEKRNPDINKSVCLPSFTCHTVYEPFIKAGYKVYTYPIGKDLMTSVQELVSAVIDSNVKVVLIHRYFGFDTLSEANDAISILRKNGIATIEDCTQSMYSEFPRLDTDYTVGSIRKWCGVPDGGFAICKNGELEYKPSDFDEKLGKTKIKASLGKYNYLFRKTGSKEDFLKLFQEAEDFLSKQDYIYNILPTSLYIQKNLDIKRLSNARRHNFNIILDGIKGCEGITPIFESLDDDVVPLYFPVLCKDRVSVQKKLANHNIYAPVVWPKHDNCPPITGEAEFIYEHILCIPIDQRYDDEDMQRIVSVLKGKIE